MDLSIRIAGEAGQGVQSAGNLLVGVLGSMGLDVLSTKSYMSRIRGGLNWFDIRIADRKLFAPKPSADLLVALTPMALEILRPDVENGGVILFNGPAEDGVIGIDLAAAAAETGGAKIMANTVAAGAVFAVLDYDVETLCEYLRLHFAPKGAELVEPNVACARRGAELASAHRGRVRGPKSDRAPRELISGAKAIALSACQAGVKFATAYPMSPATATFTYLAGYADQYGLVVEQAESEIAAVNMVCGATYAGVPAMTMTSGGGFALMVEGLSLAGMMELPIVIVLGQRPGPATGLPTRTAQQDLKFAISAGHGEFPRAVYAPGTPRQCCELTRLALQTAHRFQTPAIILTDQFLQDMETNFDGEQGRVDPIDPCIQVGDDSYRRYELSDSGVSPRAVPGGRAFVVCDSDAHTADGHITEDLDTHLAQQDKRMRKLSGLGEETVAPELYGPVDAETLMIAWGSTYGPCREAVDRLNTQGRSTAMLHFSQVFPLNASAIRETVCGRDRIISVEGNQTGQFASQLHEVGILANGIELLTRYDGLPFTARYIEERINQ